MKNDWSPFEFLLKGIYLGLLLFGATALGFSEPISWLGFGWLVVAPWAGVAVAIALIAWTQRKTLNRPGPAIAKLGYLVLENPQAIYAGLLLGTAGGCFSLAEHLGEARVGWDLLLLAIAALLGFLLALVRFIPDRLGRVIVLTLAGSLISGGLVWLYLQGLDQFKPLSHPLVAGLALLAGLPGFYFLGFVGLTDESEGEFALICAVAAVGLWLFPIDHPAFRSIVSMGPVIAYIFYTARVLPGIRVFKQAFRGFNLESVGKKKRALLAYRRALGANPAHAWAGSSYWNLHRNLDIEDLRADPDWQKLVDVKLCVQRAGEILGGAKPAETALLEAKSLLALSRELRPTLEPIILYWEAVAALHEGNVDEAIRLLGPVLETGRFDPENPARKEILVRAWLLALQWHPGLRQRLGEIELAKPLRSMEAIAAVEDHLRSFPEDADVWSLKRVLYSGLTEAAYLEALKNGFPQGSLCDIEYLQEIGKAKLDQENDWQRGGEWLRIAAKECPPEAPRFLVEMAKAADRHGDAALSLAHFQQARDKSLELGWKNLSPAAQAVYFKVVKYLAEHATFAQQWDEALKDWQYYAESTESGLETQRQIAQAHEALGEPLPALLAVEKGLVYSPKDADLLARKDRYYFSVMPKQITDIAESVKPFFDANYCLRQAQKVLNGQLDGPEWVEVAGHLLELLLALYPEHLAGRVAMARFALRMGDRDRCIAMLESVREQKPTSWISGADEEAWDLGNQLLGDLYLETGKPREAIQCLADFRKTSKSGTKTLWKLGQAFEALGDSRKAIQFYEQITAYEGNPMVYEAEEAVRRLKSQGDAS